jgi:hypothetical protein
LRAEHLERLGKPERVTIRGTAPNGFIIAAGKGAEALKPNRVSPSLHYLQTSIGDGSKHAISLRARKATWLRAEFEKGHLRVPPLPPAWINADPEFDSSVVYEEGNRQMLLPRNGHDSAALVASEAVPMNGSPTAPLPKPQAPVYAIPNDVGVQQLQAELSKRLAEAREIIRLLEGKTGMRITLDRNFKVVVSLQV